MWNLFKRKPDEHSFANWIAGGSKPDIQEIAEAAFEFPELTGKALWALSGIADHTKVQDTVLQCVSAIENVARRIDRGSKEFEPLSTRAIDHILESAGKINPVQLILNPVEVIIARMPSRMQFRFACHAVERAAENKTEAGVGVLKYMTGRSNFRSMAFAALAEHPHPSAERTISDFVCCAPADPAIVAWGLESLHARHVNRSNLVTQNDPNADEPSLTLPMLEAIAAVFGNPNKFVALLSSKPRSSSENDIEEHREQLRRIRRVVTKIDQIQHMGFSGLTGQFNDTRNVVYFAQIIREDLAKLQAEGEQRFDPPPGTAAETAELDLL